MQASLTRDDSPVVELRQYTLHPGTRDRLIDLFDREFVESQEAEGLRVLGQFRDLDAPDRFVWLRGFPDLASRAAKLEAFYGGPVWRAHRDAANATMIDSDDVLLLRPVADGFVLPETRAPTGSSGLLVATIYLLRDPIDDAFVRWFEARLAPLVTAAGATPLARFVTEYAQNEFPRLPVRTGEHAFVWFASFAQAGDHARYRAAFAAAMSANLTVATELVGHCASPPEELRLAPTSRSRLRHLGSPGQLGVR